MKFKRGGLTLLIATLMLLMCVLTGCFLQAVPPLVTLQGNQVKKMQPGESAPFDGWLLGTEAFTRLLEKAESCAAK